MVRTRGSRSYSLHWIALDRHVLIVSVTSNGIGYGVYVGAVHGEDYDREALTVVVNGSLVTSSLAEVYFEPPKEGDSMHFFHKEPFLP
jgi:hypothetical protein